LTEHGQTGGENDFFLTGLVICHGDLLTEGKTSSGHMSKNIKSVEVKSTQWQTVSYFIYACVVCWLLRFFHVLIIHWKELEHR
jgi:hypothetical protein